MAEYCAECWDKINGYEGKSNKYIVSKHLELCEGCGKYKYVIITERKNFIYGILRSVFFPIEFVYMIICTLFKIAVSLYFICRKSGKKKSNTCFKGK